MSADEMLAEARRQRDEAQRSEAALHAQNAELQAALKPFAAFTDERDARYRKRGGNPDTFPDGHPSYDINADKRELPMGVWRKARAALAKAKPNG